ncbi:hypothetical protein [Caenibacillus caldisaponilyticus]|uniref:hypothetical protein n=1 Tax=Caenibacillus caldisaponilyticus TaxID=1674942 RepID=UPI0011786F15|nr:hypothetical protein [Caenibacillus caldisaponilyticus]
MNLYFPAFKAAANRSTKLFKFDRDPVSRTNYIAEELENPIEELTSRKPLSHRKGASHKKIAPSHA